MSTAVCPVCATSPTFDSLVFCSQQCWTRWVGASPTERAVVTAERDGRIYAAVMHLARPVRDVASAAGLSARSVWQIVRVRRQALSIAEPLLVDSAGEPVSDAWRSAVASWGRPGLVLAANMLLLGRIRLGDRDVQRYLGMGEHRLRRMLDQFAAAGLARRSRARGQTGPVWVHELLLPAQAPARGHSVESEGGTV